MLVLTCRSPEHGPANEETNEESSDETPLHTTQGSDTIAGPSPAAATAAQVAPAAAARNAEPGRSRLATAAHCHIPVAAAQRTRQEAALLAC